MPRSIQNYAFKNKDEIFFVMQEEMPKERKELNKKGIDRKYLKKNYFI